MWPGTLAQLGQYRLHHLAGNALIGLSSSSRGKPVTLVAGDSAGPDGLKEGLERLLNELEQRGRMPSH